MKSGNVYWDAQEMQADFVAADILAVGDSWFWYPFPGGSLLNHVGSEVAAGSHVILAEGMNGAEAYDYVKGKFKRQVNEMLRLYGSSASALLISGGGNDFAGFNDLKPMLNANCASASSAAECFKPGQGEGCADWLFNRIQENYAMLIHRAMQVMPSTAQVILHGYAYSVPDGRGVFGGAGWLKPAMDTAKVPQELQRDCLKLLLDRFHDEVLKPLQEAGRGRIHIVDSRPALEPSDWANELHPKPKGFRKIVQQYWRPVLRQAGLA